MRIPISFRANYNELSRENVLDLYKKGSIDIQNLNVFLNILENENAKFYEYSMWSADAKVDVERGVPAFIALNKIENATNVLSSMAIDLSQTNTSEIVAELNELLDDLKISSIENETSQKYVLNTTPNATALISIKETENKKTAIESQPFSN